MSEQNSEKLRYRSMLEVDGPVPEHATKAYEDAIDQMLAHRDEAEALRKELEELEEGEHEAPVYVCMSCGHEGDPDNFGSHCPSCGIDIDEMEKEHE